MADPFISEVKYRGGANQDFIEIAVDEGYDVSNLQVTVYRENGTTRSVSDLSDLTPVTVNGKDVYVIENGDATNFNGVAFREGVALTEDGTVYSFVSFDDTAGTITATEGPAAGSTSTDIGQAGSGSSLETTDGGRTFVTQDTPTPGVVACLTAGTLVLTTEGQIKVEDLQPGMLVKTFDGHDKPLRCVLSRKVTSDELRSEPKLRPVRITAGAMGIGLPNQDLTVSRQHRMLVSSQIALRLLNHEEVLVSAIRLSEQAGIFVDHSLSEVTYYHLLFDNHEVVFANGAPTESFFLGAQALDALPQEAKEEIALLMPDVALPFGEADATRPIPPKWQQRALVDRHMKNQQALL